MCALVLCLKERMRQSYRHTEREGKREGGGRQEKGAAVKVGMALLQCSLPNSSNTV